MEHVQKQLINQACKGDPAAFAVLYREVYEDLYRFACYTLRHSQDAEDAVSEAVILAYEKIRTLRKAESFRSWMFQILMNTCRKKFKKEQQQNVISQAIQQSAQTDHTVSQAASASTVDTLILRDALHALSAEDRMLISLAVFGGYKSPEIGTLMGITAGTARSRLSRALKKMREILKEEDSV